MKRKVALIGPSTLMISLPSKWVKKYGIKKGAEIEVEEIGNNLVVSLKESDKVTSKSIDLEKLDKSVYRLIGALYKKGYDEVSIKFNSSSQLNDLMDVLSKTCPGYEVIEHGSDHLKVKEVSKPKVEDFNNILKRCFLFLISVSEESLSVIKSDNTTELNKVILKDSLINKYSDFCRRLLNKSIIEPNTSTSYYNIVEQLEKIGDSYRDLCNSVIQNKIKVNKETIQVYHEVNNYLKEFHDLFYKFNLEKLEEFLNRRSEIELMLKSEIYKHGKDIQVLNHLYNILESTFNLNGSLMVINL